MAGIAIIGAGVAGCSAAASLRRHGFAGSVHLIEMGRGPGGRCGSRRSRRDPHLVLNHGSPWFRLGEAATTLTAPLLQGGWLVRRTLREGCSSGGDPVAADARAGSLPEVLQGRDGNDALCRGLLAGLDPPVAARYGQLVSRLELDRSGTWWLRDREDQAVGQADGLVISSSLPAHPRGCRSFGWSQPPLRAAAGSLARQGSPQQRQAVPRLERALDVLAAQSCLPRITLLELLSGQAARAWWDLPFDRIRFEASLAAAEPPPELTAVVIQRQPDGRVGLVWHASPVFSRRHASLVPEGSAAAGLLGGGARTAGTGASEEASVMAELDHARERVLRRWPSPLRQTPSWRRLMRWGAAMPDGTGLPEELQRHRPLRLVFCGDGMAGEGFGRVEGALLSGEAVGCRWREWLGEPCVPGNEA
jgi:predicted NAD/FAD-dependent oxidoreductase